MALTHNLDTIRIDHIGSLVRPAKLKDVFARYDRSQASKQELTKRKTKRSAMSLRNKRLTASRSSPTVSFAATASKKVFPSASPASMCRKRSASTMKSAI